MPGTARRINLGMRRRVSRLENAHLGSVLLNTQKTGGRAFGPRVQQGQTYDRTPKQARWKRRNTEIPSSEVPRGVEIPDVRGDRVEDGAREFNGDRVPVKEEDRPEGGWGRNTTCIVAQNRALNKRRRWTLWAADPTAGHPRLSPISYKPNRGHGSFFPAMCSLMYKRHPGWSKE